ncbi:MAG: putative DNA binding domain-containing protein [Candidatus Babeliaceae bacterium]|nr:putative DNA binding domain-containing protein [Candidatus Babeliaceae bacterium]
MMNKELIEYLKVTEAETLPEEITENETRDFKNVTIIGDSKTKKRAEFLSDVIAFANSNGRSLACMYFGIDEIRDQNGKKTGRFKFIGIQENDKLDVDNVKNVLRDSIRPVVHADVITINNPSLQKVAQVLILEGNTDRPYMLKRTVIKGTEFVESSKYYREMASSTRIPSADEDRLITKWKKEDSQPFIPANNDFRAIERSNPHEEEEAEESTLLKSNAEEDEENSTEYVFSNADIFRKRIISLSEEIERLTQEKMTSEELGLTGVINTRKTEIQKLESYIQTLQQRITIIDKGYEFWDRFGLQMTCENIDLHVYWECLGIVINGRFRANDSFDIGTPQKVLLSIQNAITSGFFGSFIFCSIAQPSYDIENPFPPSVRCYIFGSTSSDNSSDNSELFLIDWWKEEEPN